MHSPEDLARMGVDMHSMRFIVREDGETVAMLSKDEETRFVNLSCLSETCAWHAGMASEGDHAAAAISES